MTENLINEKNVENAILILSKNDLILKKMFNLVGKVKLPNERLEFKNVCRIIVNQQLSGKAANTIFNRIKEKIPNLSPKCFLSISTEEMRQCGLSNAKSNYIKLLANKLNHNPLYFYQLQKLDTLSAKNEIWSNKGFGEWSSDIFLLFYLRKMDVFPKGDVTLNKVFSKIYCIDQKDEKYIYNYSNDWTPYKSVVSLAFWQFFDNNLDWPEK
jgi:DNA-3-methyladenine glycosylase II